MEIIVCLLCFMCGAIVGGSIVGMHYTFKINSMFIKDINASMDRLERAAKRVAK